MATRNYWERFSCPTCGKGFTLAQWDVRHNGRNGEEYHKDCCPECKDGTAYDDDDIDDDIDDEELIARLDTGYFDDWLEDIRQSRA